MIGVIQTAINALGFSENGKYQREMDCFDTILDLIRYLRDDSSSMDARLECGRHNLIECDLIPLLKCEDLKTEEFDITIRLLINLCQPAIASLKGKAPSDREEWKLYWDLENNLKKTKKSFAEKDFFRMLKLKLDDYFFETDLLDEKLRLLMERIILLLKYIFSINQDSSECQRTENNSTDLVIMAFIDSGLDETLIRITGLPREREFHVSIMDIFALILKEHTADELAMSKDEEVDETRRKESEEYFKRVNEEFRAKETAKRRSFSRFGGNYVLKGMASGVGARDQNVFKPIRDVTAATFNDERKVAKRLAKNKRPMEIDKGPGNYLSSPEVRKKLRKMIVNLVETGFDRMMKSAKQIVFGQKHILQRNSQINYFFLIKFVLRFVRLSKMSTNCVSQCTGVESFHENNVQLTEYVENATTLKQLDAKSFGLKAHYALGAYNEMIEILRYNYKMKDATSKNIPERTLEQVIKVEEYRDLPITLLKKFNPVIFPQSFLHEIIMGTYTYLQMIKGVAKSGILKSVTKKTKVRKAKKAKKPLIDQDNRAQFDSMKQEELDELWEKSEEMVKKVVNGECELIEDMNPLNNDVDLDDTVQQQFAMLSIQRSLRAKSVTAAVSLYRAARKIWMIDGVFGRDGMEMEEEVEELKQICMTDLKEVAHTLKEAEEEAAKKLEENDENELESDEEEEEEPCWKVEQVEFNYDEYLGRFARTEIIRWYVYACEGWKTNSVELNAAVVRMFHWIAYDLKTPTRLYQISLFNIFDKIHDFMMEIGKDAQKTSRYYELYKFGHHLLMKFWKKYAEFGPDLAVEVLFWKDAKVVYEIDNGYGSWDIEKQADSRVWTEELEAEVRNLYDEYMAMDEDERTVHVIDFIENNMTRKRKKKQVYRKMCELGLRIVGQVPIEIDPKMMSLPAGEIKEIYNEWDQLEKEEKEKKDVVEIIREKLDGDIPRRRIIKMLSYLSLNYEKPKKERKQRELPKWGEGLVKELEGLKEQYEDIDDAENILGVDIVRYVVKRLSEKKPIGQIERYLVSMGAKVPEKPKKERKEKQKKKKDDFLNDGSEEELEKSESEEEEEEEDENEGEEGNGGENKRSHKLEELALKMKNKKKERKERRLKKNEPKKRKIMLESDGEDEGNENNDDDQERNYEEERENIDDEEAPKKKAKKKVLIDSDDEDQDEEPSNGPTSSTGPLKEPEVKKISLMEKIRNRKRTFAQLDYSSDSSSDSDGKEDVDEEMEAMLDAKVDEFVLYKRRYHDDMSLVGTVAAGALHEPTPSPTPDSDDPFTRKIAYKKRKVEESEDDDEKNNENKEEL